MRLGEIGGLSKSCINTDEGSIDVKSHLNRFNEFNVLLKRECFDGLQQRQQKEKQKEMKVAGERYMLAKRYLMRYLCIVRR